MKFNLAFTAATFTALSLLAADAFAADHTERVRFKAGTSAATIKGSVTGYDTSSYLLGAKAGQVISVLFSANNNSCYFNFIEPGADSAIHMGEAAGNEYSGTLKESGDYRAEVYLMRNEARRGKTCNYSITFEISGQGDSTAGGDAVVPGTDYNATGDIPCARDAGQPMGSCKFGVKRSGGGNGTITVFWPDAGNRVIFLKGGKPAAYDQSEADGGAKMTVRQNAGLFMVTIGGQRFEIPEALIYGD